MKIYKKNKKSRGNAAAVMFAMILLALFVWLDVSTRPAIKNVIEYQTKVFAARLVNEAIAGQLDEGGADYERLVRITRDAGGEVTSIEADIVQINRLKSRLSTAVVERLEDKGNRDLNVPLGTIIGNQFTSGRGPDITIKITPVGYVQSEINNRFISAGINQTLHQIMLKVNVQIAAVLPGYSVKTETVTNFCISETVIVGKIPQGYASIETGTATFAPIEK